MKVQCTDYVLSEDKFIFSITEVMSASGRTVDAEPKALTGEQIADLSDRKLVSCDDFEIAVFLLHRKHFNEEPSDMLNKAITL